MLNRLANARDARSNDSSSSGRRGKKSNGGPLTMIVKGVAAGIGLASESYQHRKEKKKAAAEAEENASSSETGGSESRAVAPGDASAQSAGVPNQHTSENIPAYAYAESSAGSSRLTKEDEAGQDLDEVAWLLDDAQDQLAPPPEYSAVVENPPIVVEKNAAPTASITGSAEAPAQEEANEATASSDEDSQASKNEKAAKAGAVAFMARHPLPARDGNYEPLPMPVIIPQRRPGERSRGFIRAYAPLLEQVGIDEVTFMDFLTELNKAVMPSPWINAINVATLAVQHVPEPVTIAVAIASQIATQVSMTAHSRSKTNAFLNHLNAEYFAPLGLVAVVLTWKPSDEEGSVVTHAEFNETLQRAAGQKEQAKTGKTSKWKSLMQSSHGSVGFEWPESAPLVFPQLDKLAESKESVDAANEAAKKPNGFMRSMAFASEYMDKRGQAKWAAEHPESGLSNLGAKPEFRSRYADPNHPASSGNLLALLTGGAVGGGGGLLGLGSPGSSAAQEEHYRSRRVMARDNRRGGLLGSGVGPATIIQGVKKLMTEGVLYLMIANMPTPEQMAAAQQILNQAPA